MIVTLDGLAWDAASDWEKANTVIHELGHVFNLLNGLPGSKIVPDMGSVNGVPAPIKEAQDYNDSKVPDCLIGF